MRVIAFTVVSALNPLKAMAIASSKSLGEVANQVAEKLKRVIDSI